jgi:tripartite-type tricarboxylate transporter receptor subunit TctC
MKLPRRDFLHLAAGAAALPAMSRIAWAQAYPARPVRIIVNFPAGQATDTIARLMGQSLSERLGQPFVIENRTGAGGNIGTESVVRATPDGYTLLLVSIANAMNATLYKKLNFNFIREIAPVASIGGAPYVMVINPSVPAKTVPEFIAYAKANPGKINMGSSGSGSASHVFGERFKMMTGINLVHVPYRGGYCSRSAKRTGAGRFRHHIYEHPVHQGRDAALAGGDTCDPFGCATGYSGTG